MATRARGVLQGEMPSDRSLDDRCKHPRRRSIAISCFRVLPGDIARETEGSFAAAGYPVISNSSAFRMDEDVPLLIPEVNHQHLDLLARQRQRYPSGGFIVTNPNCSTIMLALALAPLHASFGVSAVVATTLQALSGAGYPGVASLDILDNVLPYIGGEEEKIETETTKILGRFVDDANRARADGSERAVSSRECCGRSHGCGACEVVAQGGAERVARSVGVVSVRCRRSSGYIPRRVTPIVVRDEAGSPAAEAGS